MVRTIPIVYKKKIIPKNCIIPDSLPFMNGVDRRARMIPKIYPVIYNIPTVSASPTGNDIVQEYSSGNATRGVAKKPNRA